MTAVVTGPTLTETLAAVARLTAGGAALVHARTLDDPAHDGLVPATALAERDVVEQLLAGGAADGGTRRDIAATFVAQGLAWALVLPGVAALLLERRVPVLDPARTALRLGDGCVPAETLLGGGVRVLAGDRLAAAPDAEPASGEAALLAALWDGLEAVLAPLLPALTAATGRPESALWRVAHDALGQAFVVLGDAAERREAAWALWARAAERAPARLRGRARPVELMLPSGARAPLLLRGGCCLVWRADGGRTCAGCPLTPDEERPALVAAHEEA